MPEEAPSPLIRLLRVLFVIIDEVLCQAGGGVDILLTGLLVLSAYWFFSKPRAGSLGGSSPPADSSGSPGLNPASSSSPPIDPPSGGASSSSSSSSGVNPPAGSEAEHPPAPSRTACHTERRVPPAASSSGKRYYILLKEARGAPGVYPGWVHFRKNTDPGLPGEFYGFPTWEEAANAYLAAKPSEWLVPTHF